MHPIQQIQILLSQVVLDGPVLITENAPLLPLRYVFWEAYEKYKEASAADYEVEWRPKQPGYVTLFQWKENRLRVKVSDVPLSYEALDMLSKGLKRIIIQKIADDKLAADRARLEEEAEAELTMLLQG